jgi:hypothetical protein
VTDVCGCRDEFVVFGFAQNRKALKKLNSTPWPESANRVCLLASVNNLYGRILGFVNRSLYFLFQVPLNCTHEAD